MKVPMIPIYISYIDGYMQKLHAYVNIFRHVGIVIEPLLSCLMCLFHLFSHWDWLILRRM